jgi:pilus assembly protein CpaC
VEQDGSRAVVAAIDPEARVQRGFRHEAWLGEAVERRAQADDELGDGQSFAIAGLLKENVRDALRKFPLLGNIPVLGALFRSRKFQKSETELVIIVTPRLVKALNMAKAKLPTDYYVQPNDAEVYLEGLLLGKNTETDTVVPAGLAGQFGHTMPGE